MSVTSDLGEQMRAEANTLRDNVAADVTGTARAKAASLRDAAAEKIENTAAAAHAATEQLIGNSPQADAVQQIAGQIEDVASRLRQTDVSTLVNQATRVARANPALFFSGAALAGFALARFLKARDPHGAFTNVHDDRSDTHV